MEALIQACDTLSLYNDTKDIDWYNNTIFNLYVRTDINEIIHVYTNDFIQNGQYIGELLGEKKYSCEIVPNPYIIFIDDDYVIDCSIKPRCIISLIQESFYEGFIPNCEMILYTNHNIKAGICACRDIYPNEELIFKKSFGYY